jgi:uncharacterized membrane protein
MVTSTGPLALLRHVGRLDSHVRQIVALVIAVVTFLFFIQHGRSPITHFIAIWDIYAIVVVLMAWVTICTANPRTIQRRASLQDSSRTLIFAFIIVAACMSLLAVILVLREHKALQKTGGLHLSMAALAVIESWLLIHTVFTLRYAHVFYRSGQEADVEGSGGGLIFPGGHNPDYQDFAYFSFVVGMTLPSVRCGRHLTLHAASGPNARPPFLCLQHGDPRPKHQHHFWLVCQLRRRRACLRRLPMTC